MKLEATINIVDSLADNPHMPFSPGARAALRDAVQRLSGEDDGTLNTVDARVWARAFLRRATDGTFTIIDEDLLVGWFANAIEYAAGNHPDVVRLKSELQELQDRVNGLRKDATETWPADGHEANTPSVTDTDWEALCKRVSRIEDRIGAAETTAPQATQQFDELMLFTTWLTTRPGTLRVGSAHPVYDMFKAVEDWRARRHDEQSTIRG